MQSYYQSPQYRNAQQKARGLADMADEVKAFTSTDPATRATAPGAGLSTGLGAFEPTGATDIMMQMHNAAVQKAMAQAQAQAAASSPQGLAQGAADTNRARMEELYNTTKGLTSHLDDGTVQGLARNAFNSPYIQADGADRGVLNAQNGGGHMGRYGSAASEAIMAGADVQRDANMAGLAADIGKYRDSFDTNKTNLLHSIAASDPTFQNYDNLYTQGQNFANQDRAFNADMSHYETDRQDRLNQQGSANQASFVNGGLAAAGGLLSNPTAMAGLGSAFGPVGTGIGAGVGVVGSAIMNGLGLAKPPEAKTYSGDGAYGPEPRRSPVYPTPEGNPLGNGQPKRYGLFGGT